MRSGLPDAPELSLVPTPVVAARRGKQRSPAYLLTSAVALAVLLSGCAYPVPVAVQPQARVTTSTTTTTTPGAAGTAATVPTAPAADGTFSQAQIDQMMAPIALYPDSLLSQVLMASTYPADVADAAKWVKAHPDSKGDAAVKAVQDQSWDPSVQSLAAFPQILDMMGGQPDWVQKLGDAFLASSKDVLDAVQRLRQKAQKAGNLKSSEQQKVIVEPAPSGTSSQTIVRIEPANPEVIYVPTYNPTVVYGSWYYPAYPPYYWAPYPAYYGYYPGAAFASGIAWGIGFAAAGAIFGNCNWGGGDVNIDVNRATNIDRNFDRNKAQGGGRWQHDASHRKGVAYRDNATRERYGRDTRGADARNEFRGRGGDLGGDRAGVSDRAGNRGGGDRGAGDRGGGTDRAGAADRGGGIDRGGAGDRSSVADRGGTGGRDNAFQGVGGGNASQRDFARGQSSSRGSSFSHSGGRGGGGGGRGGGRR